ncbi:serine/threonine protein kinase, partial [Hyalangium versicolor]|uniref:serine/threonine protein kinase n=1 Tax=Hyalangium versicolor TaxID=2861190 RepID=UPI001CCF36BB
SGCEQAAPVTRGAMPPGTWEYRSPEAWRFMREHGFKHGARYRPRPADDMYAVGVVLYWLLTDDVPFPVENREHVDGVLNRAPVPPHERNPRVPRELSELCLKLLAKQPEARPDAAGLERGVDELLARQGLEWEEPLCEPHVESLLPPAGEGDVDEEEEWARVPSRPRRGKRPARPEAPELGSVAVPQQLPAPDGVPAAPIAAPVPEVASAPEVPVASIQPPARWALPWRHRAAGVAAVGLLLMLGGLAAWLDSQRHRAALEPSAQSTTAEVSATPEFQFRLGGSLPTWESDGKVAPPLKPPEAERTVPLETEGTPTAPVAAGATAQEPEASVKTEQQKQPKRLGAAKKAAALLITCTAPACTGPGAEVRPPPVTAEACPPGSLQAMEQLGIRIGNRADGEFSWHKGDVKPVPIKEGWTTLRMGDDLGQLEVPYQLSGRVLLSEKRAYGHWVQATKDGKTYPVCLESNQPRNDEGEVESTVGVKAVREFK